MYLPPPPLTTRGRIDSIDPARTAIEAWLGTRVRFSSSSAQPHESQTFRVVLAEAAWIMGSRFLRDLQGISCALIGLVLRRSYRGSVSLSPILDAQNVVGSMAPAPAECKSLDGSDLPVVSWLDCPCLSRSVWARPRLRLSPVAAPRLGGSAVLRRRPLGLDPCPNGAREARAIQQARTLPIGLEHLEARRPGDHLADLGGAVARGGERREQRRHRGLRQRQQQPSRGLRVEEDLALHGVESGPVGESGGDVAGVRIGATGAHATRRQAMEAVVDR